ncbi:hypothetical protein [Arthrobacter oryzae]|uniref:hypothetical protein n=1 Tax=Arthrobacter oryzae TaxID=409290 RepID=UPI002784A32A|nr:hypothetical protein [Arthrobacter oryzae]
MGSRSRDRAKRRQQKLIALTRYTQKSFLTLDDALEYVAKRSAAEQSNAIQALREAVGNKRASTIAALEERNLGSALHPPPATVLGRHASDSVKQQARRPAYASQPEMIAAIHDVVAEIRKQRPEFEKLYQLLGSPSPTEIAALLQRPAMWAFPAEGREGGQANNLAGLLFQEARKLTPEFRAALSDGDRKRRAFNEALRRHLITPSSPGEAAGRSVTPEEFGPPVYYDEVLDGDNKPLSDGVVGCWNAAGHVLLTNIDEAKSGLRGRHDAPEQQDRVLARIKQRGVVLGGLFVPPEKVHLPVHSGLSGAEVPLLTAYYEGAARGIEITPGRYLMRTVGVPVPGLMDFAVAFLKAWNQRVLPTKR